MMAAWQRVRGSTVRRAAAKAAGVAASKRDAQRKIAQVNASDWIDIQQGKTAASVPS
jgi:hypothetical protein